MHKRELFFHKDKNKEILALMFPFKKKISKNSCDPEAKNLTSKTAIPLGPPDGVESQSVGILYMCTSCIGVSPLAQIASRLGFVIRKIQFWAPKAFYKL